MAEPFPRRDVDKLLADCHRRCCICHRFCGVKMETAHIKQGGPGTIENAIPLCFECHAEIGLYNPEHPRGRRFTPEELQRHKATWLSICKENPGILLDPPRRTEPGSFESLLFEVEFNVEVGGRPVLDEMGCLFQVSEFDRVITDGTYALLQPAVRNGLRSAYIAGKRANACLSRVFLTSVTGDAYQVARNEAQKKVGEAGKQFADLQEHLQEALALT